MRDWLSGLKRMVMGLALVAMVSGPLEQVLPDAHDGHFSATVAETGLPDQGSTPPGHPPSSPHTCHDLHNHTVFLRATDPLPMPVGITADREQLVIPQPPAARAQDTFRPPIAA